MTDLAALTNREVDALIAEKCMGWKVYGKWPPPREAQYPLIFEHEYIRGQLVLATEKRDSSVEHVPYALWNPWSPTTDPGAAKLARERMLAMGWDHCACHRRTAGLTHIYEHPVGSHYVYEDGKPAEDERTEMLAILRALEVRG